MPASFTYILTDARISLTLDGRLRSVMRNTDQGRKLEAVLKGTKPGDLDLDVVRDLVDVRTFIARQSFGRVIVDEKDQLRLDGKVVDFGLRTVILRHLQEDFDVSSLIAFVERVAENPNKGVAEDLYRFLVKGNLPITPEGKFRAFKGVGHDFLSQRAGKEPVEVTWPDGTVETIVGRLPHNPGVTLVMDRSLCDEDRNRTCSVGLHACSIDYLKRMYGGSQALMVEIDPADVTAIPNDYNDTKLRCCRLEVCCALEQEDVDTFFGSLVDRRKFTPEPEEAAEDEIDLPEDEDEDGDIDDLTDGLTGDDYEFWFDTEMPTLGRLAGAIVDVVPDMNYSQNDEDAKALDTSAGAGFPSVMVYVTEPDGSSREFPGNVEFYDSARRGSELSTTPVDREEDAPVEVEDAERIPPADAEIDLTDEEVAQWYRVGQAVGEDDGEGDHESGAEFDNSYDPSLSVLPKEQRLLDAFARGYADGYMVGFVNAESAEEDFEERTAEEDTEELEPADPKERCMETALIDGWACGFTDYEEEQPFQPSPVDGPNYADFEGELKTVYQLIFLVGYVSGHRGAPDPMPLDELKQIAALGAMQAGGVN